MTGTTNTVAVTGSSGKLGRAVVSELVEAGWKVHGFDLVPPQTRQASFTRIDLGDLGQVVEAFQGIDELHDGVDAVVHLGAIPGATMAANFSYIQGPEDYPNFPEQGADPSDRKWNLWGYIDIRDAARAVRLALELEMTAFEAINIAAADTMMSKPSAELMATYFPEVPFREPIEGTGSLTDIRKAERLLKWKPQHSWRDEQ